jgi:DNA-binding NarL/FixJ family response regulator
LPYRLNANRKAALSMGMRERSAVILDRHPLWLDAMDQLVAGVGIEVVGRTTDAEEALALIVECRPDMFIAGADAMSDQVDCIRRAKLAQPDLKAIVVSDDSELESIEAAFAAGASIYCVKTAGHDDMASAIRQVFERSIYMASDSRNGYEAIPEPSVAMEPAAHELTPRELEILRLVAEGHSNSQLARMLWVTEQTVKFHLSNIYRKLGVANRTEASRWAQLHGLLPHRGPESGAAAVAAA